MQDDTGQALESKASCLNPGSTRNRLCVLEQVT